MRTAGGVGSAIIAAFVVAAIVLASCTAVVATVTYILLTTSELPI
jgi:hypothetical protein